MKAIYTTISVVLIGMFSALTSNAQSTVQDADALLNRLTSSGLNGILQDLNSNQAYYIWVHRQGQKFTVLYEDRGCSGELQLIDVDPGKAEIFFREVITMGQSMCPSGYVRLVANADGNGFQYYWSTEPNWESFSASGIILDGTIIAAAQEKERQKRQQMEAVGPPSPYAIGTATIRYLATDGNAIDAVLGASHGLPSGFAMTCGPRGCTIFGGITLRTRVLQHSCIMASQDEAFCDYTFRMDAIVPGWMGMTYSRMMDDFLSAAQVNSASAKLVRKDQEWVIPIGGPFQLGAK